MRKWLRDEESVANDQAWLQQKFIESELGIYQVSEESGIPMSELYDAARKHGVFEVHRKKKFNDDMLYRHRQWLKNRLENGATRKELAERFDVHPATIGFHQKKMKEGWVL